VSSAVERAGVNVTPAISDAIGRMRERSPHLARHLDASIVKSVLRLSAA
jgi:hypothetical protein